MIYECSFDFIICKPKKSEFIGKCGVIELTTDNPIPDETIEEFKRDKSLLLSIAHHLNATLGQKGIFDIKVKSITPKTDNNDK